MGLNVKLPGICMVHLKIDHYREDTVDVIYCHQCANQGLVVQKQINANPTPR